MSDILKNKGRLKLKNRKYKKEELIAILENCLNKTLGEVDKNKVFSKAEIYPKITGIAGTVVEESVLGYNSDSFQEPDIIVDNRKTEVKTTGIRISKKDSKIFEAKEPMSVTAVSPELIINEEFETSNFWHKLEHMLLIYYHYLSDTTVKAIDYKNFPIVGYQFKTFTEDDIEILKSDWTIVRDFIIYLNNHYTDYRSEYPRISYELRDKLMLIDTAPKWPNRPRFRLKRSTITNIVQEHFGKSLEQIPLKVNSYDKLNQKLQHLTKKYEGKSIKELIDILNIPIQKNHLGQPPKSVAEQIVVKMLGGTSKKISNIDLFNKIGLIGKTITLNKEGGRTEDMKLFTIDFQEWTDLNTNFEDSEVFTYFSQNKLLCIIFRETPDSKRGLLDNIFLGFKSISFDEDFLYNVVKPVWIKIRDLVLNKKLKEAPVLNKSNQYVYNANGELRTYINFPKSKDGVIFVRGTGADSKDKPLVLNGINMYRQNIWLKGSYIVELMSKKDFI